MINVTFLVGRLGKDPELRYTQSGTAVANFSMATSETWTDSSGEKQESTVWHDIVVWRKLAEVVNEYCKKGMLVGVIGKIQKRKWEDNEGNNRVSVEVVADTVKFLEKANGGGGARAEESFGNITDSDIPF